MSLVRIERIATAIREDADLITAVERFGDVATYAARIEANAKTIADLADVARRILKQAHSDIERVGAQR